MKHIKGINNIGSLVWNAHGFANSLDRLNIVKVMIPDLAKSGFNRKFMDDKGIY